MRPFVLLVLALLSLAAASLYWLSENRRLGGRVLRLETEGDATRAELTVSRSQAAALEVELARMSEQLSNSLGMQRAMTESIAEQREVLTEQRRNMNRERRVRNQVMPDGVRQTLVDLNDCLMQDGYGEIRFHRASQIVDGALVGADFLEYRQGTLRMVSYACGRISMELNRAAGSLTMRLFDGSKSGVAGPERFPEEGLPLTLTEVDGRMWEARLPFLVTAKGEYNLEVEGDATPRLDRVTVATWLERVETLLAMAGTDLRYRLQHFRGLRDGRFTGALILAYGEGRRLAMSAEVDSLAVLIDRQAKSVSLVLRGGVFRKLGGESDIPSTGYHILLPGVAVDATIDTMLGMVMYR